MDTLKKFLVILRANSSKIRSKIEAAGLRVCACCKFHDNINLHCILAPNKEYSVHGSGCSNENFIEWNEEQQDYLDPRRNGNLHNDRKVSEAMCKWEEDDWLERSNNAIIDCGYNVDRFIDVILKYQASQ